MLSTFTYMFVFIIATISMLLSRTLTPSRNTRTPQARHKKETFLFFSFFLVQLCVRVGESMRRKIISLLSLFFSSLVWSLADTRTIHLCLLKEIASLTLCLSLSRPNPPPLRSACVVRVCTTTTLDLLVRDLPVPFCWLCRFLEKDKPA